MMTPREEAIEIPRELSNRELIRLSSSIMRNMREAYAKTEGREKPYEIPPSIATGGDALGPFVNIYLDTRPCERHERGFCTVCCYSILPQPEEPKDSFDIQLDWVLDNFDDQVMGHQTREAPFPNFPKRYKEGSNAIACLSTSGSLFSNHEVLPEQRTRFFTKLKELTEREKINLQLMVEARPEDIIQAEKEGELEKLEEDMKALNTIVCLGLESHDEFTRNVLYNKGLKIGEFEEAVRILKERGLGIGAFVFTGFHSMTQKELISDVERTLSYCKEQGVMPILMLPYVGNCTLSHLLHRYGRYHFLEPRSAVEMVKFLLDEFPFDKTAPRDSFLIGLDGGPPPPKEGMFTDERNVTCPDCSQRIWEAIFQSRKDLDKRRFLRAVAPILDCDCKLKYEGLLKSEESLPSLRIRAQESLEFAREKQEEYLEGIQKTT